MARAIMLLRELRAITVVRVALGSRIPRGDRQSACDLEAVATVISPVVNGGLVSFNNVVLALVADTVESQSSRAGLKP